MSNSYFDFYSIFYCILNKFEALACCVLVILSTILALWTSSYRSRSCYRCGCSRNIGCRRFRTRISFNKDTTTSSIRKTSPGWWCKRCWRSFRVFSKSSRSLQLIFWSFVNIKDSNNIVFVSMYKTSYNKIHLLWKVVEFTFINISNKRTIDRIAEPQHFFTKFKMLILVITIEAYFS